jgi:multisubunit Na+/H+ antiporter MnhB subunit
MSARARDTPLGWVAGILCAGVAAAVLRAVLQPPEVAGGLGPHVREALPNHAVAHAVTAVLLDFRGYDTFLELGVLLVTAIGASALATGARAPAPGPPSRVLGTLAALLLPLIAVSGIHLLALGTRAPGGAFQAGAVLGAGAILARVSGVVPASPAASLGLRLLLSVGFATFLGVGIAGVAGGRALLAYPEGAAWFLILVVESAATASIAATLFVLYLWTEPGDAA